MSTVTVGPYTLDRPLAAGGMGEIWLARHAAQGIDVAVKVLTKEAARSSRYYELFRREVQAVARLHHPGIVVVYDYGTLPREAGALAGTDLVPDSPYLVMELAGAGSLDGRLGAAGGRLPWAELRPLLLDLLQALAHAHARGVLHRDLKPGNVLLADGGAGRRGAKLADFGIAHALDRETRTDAVDPTRGLYEAASGTPPYMAPEQFDGRWRDYGPWTDLYSFGVMAYQLAYGLLPFRAPGLAQLMMQHLSETLPPPLDEGDVPPAFFPWLLRLTAKRPARRFQLAADAAFVLERLGEGATPAVVTGDAPTLAPADVPRTVVDSRTLHTTSPDSLDDAHTLVATPSSPEIAAVMAEVDDGPVPFEGVLPRPPGSWRAVAGDVGGAPLTGAGLGLFGLRSVPIVDREAARDVLWQRLLEVTEEHRAHAVVLAGGSGTGKSCLAEWFCEAAIETGAATNLRAVHEAAGGAEHGLGRMVARHFRVFGLAPDDARERIRQALAEEGVTEGYEANALVELIFGAEPVAPADTAVGLEQGGRVARILAIERLLRRVARERPVVVWLDDVQWGEEALAFAHHILDQQARAPFPALLVATARDDVLAERPGEAEALAALGAQAATTTLEVTPLGDADCRALVENLLGLSGELARQVERRMEGIPLFAVQLIGDWVQRGLLALGEGGFVLARGAAAELPDSLHTLWRQRCDRALAGYPGAARAALELAAVLGREVSAGELERACLEAAVELPAELLDDLRRSCLVLPSDGGWRFCHAMLRDSLLRSAEEGGRLSNLHQAAARMLEARHPGQAHGVAERVAEHLTAAGEHAGAIEPLLRAALDRAAVSEYPQARKLLDTRDELLARVGAPDDDVRRGEGWALRARMAQLQWDFGEAARWARQAADEAERYGWQRVLGGALMALAACARDASDYDRADGLHRRALELFEALEDRRGKATARLQMAILARSMGRLAESMELYERARSELAAAGDEAGVARCLLGLANANLQQSDGLDRAAALYADARVVFERLGNLIEVANCDNGLGEIARKQGQFGVAAERLRTAWELFESVHSNEATLARLNWATIQLELGEVTLATRHFEAGLHDFEARGSLGFQSWALVKLLLCDARAGAAARSDAHFAALAALGERARLVDSDIAEPAEAAGDAWAARGDGARASACWAIALDQWRALDEAARVAAVQAKLGN